MDIITLNVLGAFKSPASEVGLFVEGQDGFNYIALIDGKWVTQGGLRPEVIDWLKDEKRREDIELGPDWVNIKLKDFPLGPMEFPLHYGSIHHKDER